MANNELMNNFTNCICHRCNCADECEYCAQTIQPVMKVISDNLYDMSDGFVKQLHECLETFTCEYFE